MEQFRRIAELDVPCVRPDERREKSARNVEISGRRKVFDGVKVDLILFALVRLFRRQTMFDDLYQENQFSLFFILEKDPLNFHGKLAYPTTSAENPAVNTTPASAVPVSPELSSLAHNS